jgi:two-component system response regulator MtrA
MSARLVIIEDNVDIASAVAEHLRIDGYDVDHVTTAEEGLSLIHEREPSLVILDLMLPGMCGETALRSLRAEGYAVPVLILSARDQEVDKVHGFRLGADDYVTKPFGILELLARVRALLRRSEIRAGASVAPRIEHGHFVFDVAGQRVLRDGVEVDMRPKERDLLFALLDRAGQTVSRERLLRDVWGYAPGVDSRTVDWHIAELRSKLHDDASRPTLIRTVRKIGYRMVLDHRTV